MDYKKVYDQLIERAKTRILTGYRERHHIIPKCQKGTNEKENIVNLTAREHYLCHWLLCRMYPEDYKLAHAFWFMSWQKSPSQKRYYTISSRVYAEAVSNIRFTEEHKGKISKWRRGRKTIVHPTTKEIKYVLKEELKDWLDKGWENTNYKKGNTNQISENGRKLLAECRRREQTGRVGLDAKAAKGPYTVIYEDGRRVTKGSYPELVKATGIPYSTLQWRLNKSPGSFSKGFAVIKGE